MNVKTLFLEMLRLGIENAELEDGTCIEGVHFEPGRYPCACHGSIVGIVNGQAVRFPHRLGCQHCGGCE
ncbi:hypothetical protein AN618_18780 [Fervidicola ferrireducens]|uniref:Uncharacterized protein n=1 Tax=Fervidicola ferrireducens TaxID=520764 RepID=A0A140L4N0_9FIRM|nr:hypothetical protein [Fervidicola ferrireducens]KXG75505.1 hypothetical protein AN618_18780 [Fervidicola ferrireducens]